MRSLRNDMPEVSNAFRKRVLMVCAATMPLARTRDPTPMSIWMERGKTRRRPLVRRKRLAEKWWQEGSQPVKFVCSADCVRKSHLNTPCTRYVHIAPSWGQSFHTNDPYRAGAEHLRLCVLARVHVEVDGQDAAHHHELRKRG